MNEQRLFAAIGDIDERCLQRCEAYRPAQSWKRFLRCVAVFAIVVIGLLSIPEVRAGILRPLPEDLRTDYIQLPPELTTWSEPVKDSVYGGYITSASVFRGEVYKLTRDEYLRIQNGANIDVVLSDRDTWAAEWKDYEPPKTTIPSSEHIILEDGGEG